MFMAVQSAMTSCIVKLFKNKNKIIKMFSDTHGKESRQQSKILWCLKNRYHLKQAFSK